MWVVYSGEVRGDVGMRSRMCYIGYELSDFPLLLYKAGIVEGYKHPVWMCAKPQHCPAL